LLDITGRRSVGNDQIIAEYDAGEPAGSQIRRYQIGSRVFTLSIQVRSSLTADDQDALHFTSLLRDSASLPELSSNVFEGAEIAFARVLSEVDIPYELDGRQMSIAQLDMMFNASSLVEDTATGWIETLDDFEFRDADNPVPPLWTGDIEVD
jgi:hypothetical protein